MTNCKTVTSVLLATALCMGTAYADKPEHTGKNAKKEKKYKTQKHDKKEKHNRKNFSSSDEGRVFGYYRSLPPGLAKKLKHDGKLPPGWQNKVSVGERIPQEYIRYAQPVPSDLERQISVGPIGSKILQIGDRVVRIEAGTNMVLDALRF